MLPYSGQPIPLPISYRPPRKDPRILSPSSSNQPPSQPLPTAATRLFNKRFPKDATHPLASSNVAASSPPPSLLSLLQSLQQPAPSPSHPPSQARLPSAAVRPFLPLATSTSRHSFSSVVEDVLAPGDFIGEGLLLQGHSLTPPAVAIELQDNSSGLATEFQVVRKLGTGSYAVVYLVRESYVSYGREFALKCLSKANLDEEALIAQLSEVKIHQSLPSHPNIVTLHRTLETPAFLLLILEYVPGEDLFYFLEQARDHYEPTPPVDDSAPSRTPPTPSLLASLHPTQLLSSTPCHEQGVFHRDIKPENFIVTDGFVNSERRVVVKLTDFGLSTTEEDCSDMDCGSAPYMSFECADVWSLGIVLINMLYHYNPWTDTAEGVCPSFTLFRQQGTHFFMNRFTGMTSTVADFLATRVFHLPPTASWSASSSHAPSGSRIYPAHFDVCQGIGGIRTPVLHPRSLSVSRAPSVSASVVGRAVGALETVMDSDIGEASMEESEGVLGDVGTTTVHAKLGDHSGRESTKENDSDFPEDGRSRRGARKSKNVTANEGDADETLQVLANAPTSDATTAAPTPTSIMPPMVRKASRWLSFGKGGNNASLPTGTEESVAGTANNVATLIMGLAAPPSAVTPGAAAASSTNIQTCSQSCVSLSSPSSTSLSSQPPPRGSRQNGASSVTTNSAKSNWRSSLSSTASSSMSAFTRYNHSSTSVSTMATSESPRMSSVIMSGVPRELDRFPRDPMSNDLAQPPQRKARTRKPKDSSKLDTISERPSGPSLGAGVSVHKANTPGVVVHQRQDASTSTTELDGIRPTVTAKFSDNVNICGN
ncbi:CAMK/CAMK-unique protein kinase [Pisolithus microcarpus]|nr:CAMK/CAMK-unique protein kinase [Pisolithus microcarpus]